MASCSRNVVLVCEECGERAVLVGPLSAWRSKGVVFECGCGEDITLTDRLDQKTAELATVAEAQRSGPRR